MEEDYQVELPSTISIILSIHKYLGEDNEWTEEQVDNAAAELRTLYYEEEGSIRWMTKLLEMNLRYANKEGCTDLAKEISIKLSVVKELFASRRVGWTPRVSSCLTGMDIELAHELDVKEFVGQIKKLLKWHETDHDKYAFPYFTLIQSSGMGKTRLLKEAKDQLNAESEENRACMTIYCHDNTTDLTNEESKKYVYDSKLKVTRALSRFDNLYQELDEIIYRCRLKKANPRDQCVFVLLFDEVQLLLDHRDGYGKSLFQKLCWWLRASRYDNVVAVLTGTSTRLFTDSPGGPPSQVGTARDPMVIYQFHDRWEPGKIFYPPWIKLRTIGCLRRGFKNVQKHVPPETEFERSSLFGRPLFAAMNREHQFKTREEGAKVVNKSLFGITHRILLGRSVTEGRGNFDKAVVCSVVGSRVQMGLLTSFDVASRLVSESYTCLVDLQFDKEKPLFKARTCTMPDPICAGLAMGLMDEKWSVETERGKNETLRGISKKKWVMEVKEVFSSGLCQPEKGDPGEIFAALYMLFCGDDLRRKKDESLRTFSVPLKWWFALIAHTPEEAATLAMNHPMESPLREGQQAIEVKQSPSAPHQTRAPIDTPLKMEDIERPRCMDINFVQVCRDYFRSESFLEQGYLEHLYNTATAVFVNPICAAIDMVGAIKVVPQKSGELATYHPLLVSVKNWGSMTAGQVINAIDSMHYFVESLREKERVEEQEQRQSPTVLCILLSLGCQAPPTEYTVKELESFPSQDTFRCVSIPENDAYGISRTVASMGGAVERSEILSSHFYLAGLESCEECLGSKSKHTPYVQAMFDKLKSKDDTQEEE